MLAATEALVPSIELIDTRITDWKIGLCDTIADNASSAGFVLGEARASRQIASRGSTRCCAAAARSSRRAAPMRRGETTLAAAWLARKVDGFGVRLRRGDVVLLIVHGSDRRTPRADNFVADFAGLGFGAFIVRIQVRMKLTNLNLRE